MNPDRRDPVPPRDDIDLLRVAIEATPAGILAVDADGTILLVNREVERLFGYDRAELIGRSVDLLVPAATQGIHPQLRGRYLTDPHARPMGTGRDLYGLRKDGTQILVEIGLNPVSTERGRLVVASIVDTTARRRLENQLRQSQKMEAMGTLAGGIAHDFNNVLHGIIGYTELAQRAAGADSGLQEDFEQVLAAAERGRQLIERIMAFSRRHDVERKPNRLDRPVTEALQLLRASLPATVEIRTHLDPQTPAVRADDTEIQQVVMNLATNAAHAMTGRGGVLGVDLEPLQVTAELAAARTGLRPGLHARLCVSDTGRGIAAEDLARVFEPFFTTKAVGEGTGLGLSMVHGIVVALAGAIGIDSRLGEGTRVEVLFPAASLPHGAAPSDDEREPERGADRGAKRVLLVDDERRLAQLIKRQLEEMGYAVTMHTSSLEALAEFRAHAGAFDLMITDNTMPHLTGVALAGAVKELRPDLPILMISGIADTVDAATLVEMGVAKVLSKPHSFAQLEAALRSILETPDP
jgi:PAS domain S-box-containing protein